jgi:hypothetical protein
MYVRFNTMNDVVISSVRLNRCLFERESECVGVNMNSRRLEKEV